MTAGGNRLRILVRGLPRRTLRGLLGGLTYIGAAMWISPEVFTALSAQRTGAGAEAHRDPDRITPYDDLPTEERRLLLGLDDQFRRESER
jgi:hypothetical protein